MNIRGPRWEKHITHLELAELYFCRCRNDIGLVDPTERNTVDLVGASDKEKTAFELLQENDALSTEAASE